MVRPTPVGVDRGDPGERDRRVAARAIPLHEPALGPEADAAGGPRIWALGGGKGGVGKSVVTSNLAAALAASGRRVVVVDADLGGANLHTLLGVARPRRTLAQLWTGEADSLAELMLPTSVPHLWLVSGNGALLDMANPRHAQKQQLLRLVRRLDVDEVVLDLGAGSSFNVLDFFLLARRRLVVVTPEPTAIENAEHFLRAALYRSLRDVAQRPDVRPALGRLRERSRGRPPRSARELIDGVRGIDPDAARLLEERADAFAPLLVANQLQPSAEHARLGPDLVADWRERLGIAVELAAGLGFDPCVATAVARRQPALQAHPRSRFARQIERLARGLARDERDAPPATARQRDAAPAAAPAAPRALPPFDRSAPGAHLRRCREALGLSLDAMTERTRIRNLADIEAERFERLPPEPYLRGYLLEYGRELGLTDLGELTASYLAKCPAPAPAAAPGPEPAPRRFLRWRR